jgi:D-amino-acid dehydrogenase
LLSQQLYENIKGEEKFSFKLEKKGLFMLCKTDKMLEEELKVLAIAQKEGLDGIEINRNDFKKIEPNVDVNFKGGIYFKCDAHITPKEFMDDMKLYLKNEGVQFIKNEKVIDFEIAQKTLKKIRTIEGSYVADEFVLATGTWTSLLSKKLGLNLLVQAGKGYCINTKRDTGMTIPTILAESKVAVTPMNGFTRFAGTMEIAGINSRINKIRVETIAKAVTSFYPNVRLNSEELNNATSGLRPVSPDGLPFIGRTEKCKNVTVATGHAMMGLTMGTATGKLVSEIISDKQTSLNLLPFQVDRSF